MNFELAKSFAKNSEVDVEFFFYSVFFNRFQKTTIEEVVEQNKYKGTEKEESESLKSKLKLANLRVVLRVILPFRIRRALKNMKKTIFRASLVSGPFSKGDYVVVLSDIWGLPGANEGIASLRKTKGLRVGHLVHDLIPVVTPQFVLESHAQSFKEHIDHTFANTDFLITTSDSNKKDINKYIEETGKKKLPLIKFRLGDQFEENIKANKAGLPERLGNKGFILCVGTIEIRKNHRSLYYAYKKALAEGKHLPHLVVAGRKGWLADDVLRLFEADREISEHVTVLNNASDAQLEWLYQNCEFTVYPSFYEGWGLPIVESLRHGKLCITSSTSAMPEAGGDLAIYVDPFSVEEIGKSIDVAANSDIRKTNQNIAKKYKTTSWEEAAQSIAQQVTKL